MTLLCYQRHLCENVDLEESHNEKTRRIGKAYWQNRPVSQPGDFGRQNFRSAKNRPDLSQKKWMLPTKPDLECYASHTFSALNREVISDYLARHPRPKEWINRNK